MPAADVALPLRIGARTVWTLRRRLVRRRIALEEALAGVPPRLPPLGEEDEGYLLTGLPEGWADALSGRHGDLKAFVRQRYRRSYARLDRSFDDISAPFPPRRARR